MLRDFIVSVCCVWLVLSSASPAFAAKWPADLPQCNAGDETCLREIATRIIQEHPKGHSGLAIPPLEPLRINAIDIVQGDKSPIAVRLQLRDQDMTGLSKMIVTKISGFEIDPTNGKLEMHAHVPKVTLSGLYTIQGKVLVLPIQGDGKSRLDFEDLDIMIKCKPNMFTKNGRQYIETDKFKMDFTTKRFGIHFTNLFNGDRMLGDNMNLFLNENSADILAELKPSISLALEQIFEIIVNRIFAKVPYDDLFVH